MKRKFSPDTCILFLIIITGAALRLIKPFEIPFTFDELSALNRIKLNSFHELIEKGVMHDGHPAGIQIFLYYWSKLFGISELVTKLPFILFGIASIAIVYSISKKWFSSTTGLLASACMATLQFPITFSDIARPYISGLFFSLLMVLFWTNYFFEGKRKFLNLAAFAISAALCAYNHYFSLLFAVIVGATGIFLLTKEKLLPYLFACVFAILLFTPHLSLFLFQYKAGGLDWLGKPTDDFLVQFIDYIFHYSPLVISIILLISIFGFFNRDQEFSQQNKFRLICLLWFLLPYIVGFNYSIYVKPVLQFSVLIFSFPYLLIFLFSFYDKKSTTFKIVAVFLLILVNTFTLIFTRKHYQVFFKQPVEQYALHAISLNKSDCNPTIIYNVDTNYINYYFRKLNFKPNYYSTYPNMLKVVDFKKFIASNSSDCLITGGIPLEYVNMASEYYPFEKFRDYGYGYEIFCFSKTDGKKAFAGEVSFESTFTEGTVSIDSTTEWGPSFTSSLDDLIKTNNRHQIVDISLSLNEKAAEKSGLIVFELTKNNKTFEWRGRDVSDFIEKEKINEWQKAYLSVRLSDIFKSHEELKNAQLKIFYWNHEKKNVQLKDFHIRIRKGNDWVYGLFDRLN